VIPYARQTISEADVAAVVDVLRSDWLTQGPSIERFEDAVRARTGAGHAVAMHNGTAGLHLACLALDLGPGDALWTSANTFAASANCARYCGADVDFIDIEPDTYNMSVSALREKLAVAEIAGRLPKIVVPVHFGGQPCDLRAIAELARRYRFRVIEDASHALGAELDGEKVGNGRYSDITILSFHPVKIITTGEGGMAVTNNAELAARLRLLRTHGITRDPAQMSGESQGPWYYEQIELGFNYRMTDIQAALGTSQLARLDQLIARRRQLAQRYSGLLVGLPIRLPVERTDCKSAWHLYVINIDDGSRKSRRAAFEGMRERGVGVNVHYIPVHLQPYYRALGFREGHCPVAEQYYQAALTLPLFPALTDADQDKVGLALREVLEA
jgi:UDP-4-amino-4,6-dideoxy-N-acetyl-beta-L-altrosamine transaminase